MKERDEQGIWKALSYAEIGASETLNNALQPFHAPIEACLECGVAVPTLPANSPPSDALDLTALFLKRCLGDLRSTWLLCLIGYTPQAASVAASAFENAFTVIAILADPANAPTRIYADDLESPWSPIELCKIRAATEHSRGTPDFERRWREFYSHYKLLCKIKHPTLAATRHDARAAATTDDGEYAVVAVPDIRPVDLPLKAVTLATATNHLLQALFTFGQARDIDKSERCLAWRQRMLSAINGMRDAYKEVVGDRPLPFNLYGTKFEQEYRNLGTPAT
jgi:hypothetical protein